MEWINRLEESLEYIENNLTGDIESEELSKISQCSFYHYQRVFSYVAGIPLAEYIRRRKLSAASIELQQKQKVIDVALKYGYDSPTSFSKAFKKLHGVTPSMARLEGVTLKTYPRIRFHITIKGDVEMEYRIETKEGFDLIGLLRTVTHDIETNYTDIPLFWNEVAMDGTVEKLGRLMNGKPVGLLGVGTYDEGKPATYFIGVANESNQKTEFETYHIDAYTWAIFSGQGKMPDAIQDLGKRIMTEWLPTSGYEYADGPDIELYLNPNPQDAKFEIWVPVVKK